MPRFYFHLSAPDQDFPDNIGSDLSDLTAAHSIAVRLMKRVMMISSFADCAPDLRRWIVKVADERGRPVFTVMFPRYFLPRGWKPFLVSGARALLPWILEPSATELYVNRICTSLPSSLRIA
jgi:hypothetical protein